GYSGGLSLLRLTRQTKTSHYRVSLQRCWRSFPQGYSLRYRLQLLLRPLKVLLHSCPVRRRLLLEISVTSVGIEKCKLLLNHANETVERFHQRVTLLFASLAVGVVAAFLLEQFGSGLNLRPLPLNQVAQRKRLRGHRQNQRSSGSKRLHCETLTGRGFIDWLDVGRDFIVAYRCQQKSQQKLPRH